MRVDGLVFADDRLMEAIVEDQALEQVANVAGLPGIQVASLAMPDIHWGYGFCIGGVCATDADEGGVVSPGGVGYDINCGVRLIRSSLTASDVQPRMEKLVRALFDHIPTGTGRSGKYHFDKPQLRELMQRGPAALVTRGLATTRDVEFTEGSGCVAEADPGQVSDRAFERGADQCGTLGAGNHFLEVQVVHQVVDRAAAEGMGLCEGMIWVLIYSGSRGLGYQVGRDPLRDGGNLPYMNFPGPKIWASAGVVPLSSRYSWQPIVSQVTSVMLNIVAVWLLTSGVDAPSRLRFYARWVPVLSIGLLAGIAAQARGGTIFNWNIAEQDRSKFYAIVTVICEVPGTFLLYLLLSRLATQLGCRALAMKSLALGALVVACVSAGPAMFLLRGASRGDRTSWLVLLMARRTARRTAPW